jgi:hypothetical protein
MRFSSVLRSSVWLAALCLCAQEPKPPSPPASLNEAKRLLPRGGPSDYQAQAKAGAVTIGAEFMRHAIPAPDGTFSNEDYVAVEVGLFGASGARTKISIGDFSLRINGKKALTGQPYGLAFENAKDPSWQPPEPPPSKSGGLTTGGDSGQGSAPPVPPKMPLPLVRVMPEGDRALPEAGLLFFAYHGNSEKIKSVVLTYSGPAGKATLNLQP